MKVKELYWLVSPKSPIHDRLFEALRHKKVAVNQVHTFQDLCDRFNQKRLGLVIIGDELSEEILLDQLPKVINKPEFNGVRFLLSISHPRPGLCRLAVTLGFRDIISIDLAPETWIKRFEFAGSSGEMNWYEPNPQMTLHSISAISIPARITWMDSQRLKLESKIIIPKGGKARLIGKIGEELGLSSISIRVLEHSRTDLKFRFSEAYLCEWETPSKVSSKRSLLLDGLKIPMDQAPFKIFVAVKSFNLRQLLIQTLKDRAFDLTLALQKSGLMHETKFIDPDVIIIEHRLIDSKSEIYLTKMVEHIRSSVPIYIIGASKAEQGHYEQITGRKDGSLIVTPQLPPNFLNYLKRKLDRLMRSDEPEAGYYIPRNHRFSFAELRLPARMIQIHPESARMVVPYELGRFGFCMIDAPIFKQNFQRRVVGKIVHSYLHKNNELESFPHVIELAISDLLADERQRLAHDLVKHFAEQLLGQRLDFRHLQFANPKEKRRDEAHSLTPSMKKTLHSPTVARRLSSGSLPDIPIREEGSFAKEPKQKPFLQKHSRELQITTFAIFLLMILFAFIYIFRQPENEQGKAYSESFRKIYEYYNNERGNR
ncbi:MAG: hypothetical protein ACOH5I_12830 [Oligoflexus sp.]